MNQMVRGLHKVCHRGVSLLTPSSLSPPIFLCLKLGRVPGHLRTHSIKTTTAMTASRLHHLVPIHSVSSKNDGTNGSLSSSNAVATEDEGTIDRICITDCFFSYLLPSGVSFNKTNQYGAIRSNTFVFCKSRILFCFVNLSHLFAGIFYNLNAS